MQIELMGGLGNQMFIYAFYLSLKNKYSDKSIYIDTQNYKKNDIELSRVFDINIDTIPVYKRMRYKVFPFRLANTLNIDMYCYRKKPITDQSFASSNLSSGAYLKGFWQSEDYFSNIESTIKEIYSFHKPVSNINNECINEIKQTESVSIHIRRGDYLNNNNKDYFLNLSDTNYYDNAINLLGNRKFFIFSDDIEWCRHRFNNIDAVFVDWNKGENSWIDMYLMSLCKMVVVANSSFSWWGAYLNSSKTIFVPSYCGDEWEKDHLNFFPKKWKRIEVN